MTHPVATAHPSAHVRRQSDASTSKSKSLFKPWFKKYLPARCTSSLDPSFTYLPLHKLYCVVTRLTMNQSSAHSIVSPQCTSFASENVPRSSGGGVCTRTAYGASFGTSGALDEDELDDGIGASRFGRASSPSSRVDDAQRAIDGDFRVG